MAFTGWSARALEFYEGLQADNSKTYWTEHKAVYDRDVYPPMIALLADLAEEFGAGKVFRPYRDVRFSADKSPYKTAIGATLERGGYIQLSSEGLAAGCGYYRMAADQLDRYRRAVADDASGAALQRVIADLAGAGTSALGVDSLRTAPRGYPRDHPRAELLRHKGLIAWQQWPVAAWLGTARARGRLVDFLRSAQPLRDWLATQVGDSTEPAHR